MSSTAADNVPPDEPEKDPSARNADGQGSITPLGWKPTPSQPVPVVRCTQIKKDGHRCNRWSLRGYVKCVVHAGPGVMSDGNIAKYADGIIEAARLRLVDSADMALDTLDQLIQPGSSEGIRLKAATEVLDRAGIRGGFDIKVEATVEHNPAETIQDRLSALLEGSNKVKAMQEKARRAAEGKEEADDIVDADVIDDDDQETLF